MKNSLPLVIVASVASAALIVFSGVKYVNSDRKAPEITFPNNLTYDEKLDEEDLLDGVRAYDEKDGDVTDSLVVESVTISDDNKSSTVVYAARDSKNNVAKAIRFIASED